MKGLEHHIAGAIVTSANAPSLAVSERALAQGLADVIPTTQY